MRPGRLPLLPLMLLLVLVPAAPATAADWTVDVTDFEYTPAEIKIQVGDSVTWTFTDGGHTSTSFAGQAENWNSGFPLQGEAYSRIFAREGRFRYFCEPHPFMEGVVQVGDPPPVQTLASYSASRRGRSVTVRLKLNQAARVSYRLRGPTPKRVKRGRLTPGSHRFKVRRLARGRYRGVLKVVDDFGKTTTRRRSFVIR